MSVSHNEARTHPSLSPPNNAIILNTMPSYLWEQCCIMNPYRDSLEQNSHDLITSEKCHCRSLLHSTPSFFLIQSSWQSKWPASLAHLSGLSHISSLLPALPVSPPTTRRAPLHFHFCLYTRLCILEKIYSVCLCKTGLIDLTWSLPFDSFSYKCHVFVTD